MRILVALALAFSLLGVFRPASASAASCSFQLGFASLDALIPQTVGICLENQHYAPNGDAQQQTTGGLLVWRKADNWTAFTDGNRTWINGPFGLESRFNDQRFTWENDNLANPNFTIIGMPQEIQTCGYTPTIDIPKQATNACIRFWIIQDMYEHGLFNSQPTTQVPTPPIPTIQPNPVTPPPAISNGSAEWVGVVKVLDDDEHAIIVRQDGQAWLLHYGVGCIGLSFEEGKAIILRSPGLFAGIGSHLILPDQGQNCDVLEATEVSSY